SADCSTSSGRAVRSPDPASHRFPVLRLHGPCTGRAGPSAVGRRIRNPADERRSTMKTMNRMMLCLAWLGVALAAPATAQMSPATVRIASTERVPHAAAEPAPSADLRLDRSLDRIRKATAPYL